MLLTYLIIRLQPCGVLLLKYSSYAIIDLHSFSIW